MNLTEPIRYSTIFSNTNNLTVNIKVEDVVVEVVFSVT